MMYQGWYGGKKLGNPRTEKEKIQVEPYYNEITWSVVEDVTDAEGVTLE